MLIKTLIQYCYNRYDLSIHFMRSISPTRDVHSNSTHISQLRTFIQTSRALLVCKYSLLNFIVHDQAIIIMCVI